jgi:hypothetical protein
MGHNRLTYLDIPESRRRATAGQALGRLKDALGNPALTVEQATAVRNKITRLNQWAAGKLGTDYSVEIAEEVEVSEVGQGEV